MIECGAATIVTVLLATLAAYAFARMHFRGKTVLFYAVIATMAFPAYTTLIPLYRIMSTLGLVNTYTGIVLVYVSGFLPLATWILHNYFASLPSGIEEAGLVDGAHRLQVLWHLLLPLARPGIISTALITFLFAWGQFLFPLVLSSDLSTQPLTVVIASLQGRHVVPSTLLNAAGVLAIIVPAVLALAFNRYIVNGLLVSSASDGCAGPARPTSMKGMSVSENSIVLIGAGSTVFTPGLMTDLASSRTFDGWTVHLVDLNGEAAETMARVGRRIAAERGAELAFVPHVDRREALPRARFVTTTIAVGAAMRLAGRCRGVGPLRDRADGG